MGAVVTLLGIADLVARWIYTKQGVHKLARTVDFSAPRCSVNLGRTKLWAHKDVKAYEQTHPEVLDEIFKVQKIVALYRASLKGDRDNNY